MLNWRRSYAGLTIAFGVVLVTLLGFALYSAKKEVRLSFSSGQTGGVYRPMAKSIADLVERELPDARIEVLESVGSAENAARLIAGEVDLALVQNDSLGDESLRSLVPLHLDALHFLATMDSGVETLGDLEGKRVAVGLESSGSHHLVEELLHHFELSLESVELLPVTIEEGCRLLAEGEVDAMLMMLSLRSEIVDQLVDGGNVRFVGIGRRVGEGSIIDGFRLSYPFVEPFMIPRFSYGVPHGERAGVPDEAVPTVAVRSVLVTTRELPDLVARQITRAVVENRNHLSVANRDISMLDAPNEAAKMQFPLHEGALQYYSRNEPGFLVRYAEVIGLLVSLAVLVYGVVRTGKKWLNQGQKDRIDAYYLELNRLLDKMQEPLEHDELSAILKQLQRIRSAALRQLAKERLSPDESFRIFQTVLAEAGVQARHKLEELER